MYITRYHRNLGTYCIQATPSCTTHTKVELFGESQSWAPLSNSFHSSPPAYLPEGLIGITDHPLDQPRHLPHACLTFT